MKKKYIVPIIKYVQVEYGGLIATSQAGTDTAKGDNFKYDGEVIIDVGETFGEDTNIWQ